VKDAALHIEPHSKMQRYEMNHIHSFFFYIIMLFFFFMQKVVREYRIIQLPSFNAAVINFIYIYIYIYIFIAFYLDLFGLDYKKKKKNFFFIFFFF